MTKAPAETGQGPRRQAPLDSTMPPFDLLLSRCDMTKAKKENPARGMSRSVTVRCLAHPDKSPSLSIAERDDGNVLFHCHAGCSKESILEAAGLEMIDLIHPDNRYAQRIKPHAGPRFSAWQALQAMATDVIVVALCAAEIRRRGWLDDADLDALIEAESRIQDTIQAGGLLR